MDDWKGTKKELLEVVEYVIKGIKEESYSDMSDKDFNKLFLEAFTRNLVQNELADTMEYIIENEMNV